MSFLNPVNEPVLRFKSTDAGAPQINYNSRTAGDVKAVLKACLVTGYGTAASAGWTTANEVDHVCEFVSPSAAMSDYRLGIDDTSASSTTWYYQYQDAMINPVKNTPTKSFGGVDKTHVDNGWRLFVTDRGLLFVELLQHTAIGRLSARITYLGMSKSAVTSTTGANFVFYNLGVGGQIETPYDFYKTPNINIYTNVHGYTGLRTSSATQGVLTENVEVFFGASQINLVSRIYLVSSDRRYIVAELPAIFSVAVNESAGAYGFSELSVDGRPVFSVTAGTEITAASSALAYSRTFYIQADYWEY